MKKILIVFLFVTYSVQAQTFEQDKRDEDKFLQHALVATSDGYTGNTALTPTCKVSVPGTSTTATCANAATELDATNAAGVYRVVLSAAERERPGTGMMVLTGTASIPSRIPFNIVSSKLYTSQNLISDPNNLGATTFTKTGATVTQNTSADFNGDSIADTLTGDGATSVHQASFAATRSASSGYYVVSADIKSGTLNNAWIGDGGWGAGVDINTSTGVVTPATTIYLRGYSVMAIGSSWYRVSVLYQAQNANSTAPSATLALGNGTGGASPSSFASSGTMLFARAVLSRAEDVPALQLEQMAFNLQSATTSASMTLAANETATSSTYVNREICVWLQNGATQPGLKSCDCIATYNGATKVATTWNGLGIGTPSSSYKYKIGGVCNRVMSVYGGGITTASFAAGAIDATAIATDAITAAKIAASAIASSELDQTAADKVWATAARTITGGTITTNSDKAGYSLSGTQTFNNSGSVGSVAGSVTGSVGSVTGSVGSVTGSVGSVTTGVTVATNGINAASLDVDTIGASEFSQAAADKAKGNAAINMGR